MITETLLIYYKNVYVKSDRFWKDTTKKEDALASALHCHNKVQTLIIDCQEFENYAVLSQM